MILSIHQPSYFPWSGLLDKIAKSDVYMIMDEIQLSDGAYQHRNLFLTADGKVKYLTIPFNKRDYLHRPLKDLEITDSQWRIKHLNFIRNTYRKHPYANEILPRVESFYSHEYPLLINAVLASMVLAFEMFDITTKVIYQSAMEYDRDLKRGDLVVALVKAAGADCYLSGTGAQAYLDESAFTGNLSLQYNTFSHPAYPQKGVTLFLPGLACLDMLFNLGITESRTLLRRGSAS